MPWQGVIRVELHGPVTTPELVLNTFVNKLANAINFSVSTKGKFEMPRSLPASSLKACLRVGSAGENWDDLCTCMHMAGSRLRREKGRPAVLVIDGVEFLKENEKFMATLVGYAKASARLPQSVTEQRVCG